MGTTEPFESIQDWQSRLADTFRGPRGIVAERLTLLHRAEQVAQSECIENFRGYMLGADAFFDFAIQSSDILAKAPGVYHVLRVPLLVASVSRLRSSYLLFLKGYWFDAASLLRGVFENAVHLCASAHGWFDLGSRFDVQGIDLTQKYSAIAKKRHRLRQAREANVLAQVYGDKSGLSAEDQEQLASLVTMMHAHVHETEMHLVHLTLEVIRSKKAASVFPVWDNHQASHYADISLFLAWAFTRLFSYAVPEQHRSVNWTKRRDVLDGSLRLYFLGWDKPISASLVRFIDAKFTFAGEWAAPSAGAR